MSKISVYTTKTCPNCQTLKKILNELGTQFVVINMTTSEAMTQLTMNNIFTMSAPVLQNGNDFYTSDKMMTGDTIDRQKVKSLLNI